MSAEATARAVEGAAEATDDWKSTWRLVGTVEGMTR